MKTILPNGNSYSKITVVPKNWESGGSELLLKKWVVQYTYYVPGKDPRYIKKTEFNEHKTLKGRREAVKKIIKGLIFQLEKENFNPVENTAKELEVIKDTNFKTFNEAIDLAFSKLEVSNSQLTTIRSVVKFLKIAIINLNFGDFDIKEIERKDILLILKEIEKIKIKISGEFSNENYNHHLKQIHRIFEEMITWEITRDYNPCLKIPKKVIIEKLKIILEPEQVTKVNSLKTDHYNFWRFIQIFFHSGIRINELLRVPVKDVNLNKQEFKALILKGKKPRWVIQPIKTIVLPLWVELLEGANPDFYIFAKDQKPGYNYNTKGELQPIGRKTLSDLWLELVKDQFSIEANLYRLKHLNLDQIDALTTNNKENIAQIVGNHEDERVTEIYTVNKKQRKLELLKQVNNEFIATVPSESETTKIIKGLQNEFK
jgi:hypothetical protein